MARGRNLRLVPEFVGVVQAVSRFLHQEGVEAYVTGGFVRDLLLSRPAGDLDISINGDPLEIGPRLAEELGGTYFPLDRKRHHARIMLPGGSTSIDLLPMRGSIDDDLRLRDFTVGALAADLSALAAGSGALIIDPTGGLGDLDKRVVRAVSEKALLDDPLRLLRGVRLAVQLGFDIEPKTTETIREHAASVRLAAPERRRDELVLILGASQAAQALRLLEEVGLLAELMPELDVMRGVEQPKEHHWDVFGHSIEAVRALDWLIADSPPASHRDAALWRELQKQLSWWPEIESRWHDEVSPGIGRSTVLKLAALLHDIGKPATKSVDPDGRIRFFGHSAAGSDIAGSVLKRLRLPTRVVDHVTAMIHAHLRPLLMAREGAPSRRALYRFFRDTGDAGVDTLFLSLADHLATVGPRVTTDGWRRHVAVVGYILAGSLQQPEPSGQQTLVNGDDLMAELAIGPGALVGELLEAIAEAQAAGEVGTREEAIDLAHNFLARNEKTR